MAIDEYVDTEGRPTRDRGAVWSLTDLSHPGAVLTTLSVPLYVKGQRYGCVCLGWDPEQLRR